MFLATPPQCLPRDNNKPFMDIFPQHSTICKCAVSKNMVISTDQVAYIAGNYIPLDTFSNNCSLVSQPLFYYFYLFFIFNSNMVDYTIKKPGMSKNQLISSR